MNSTVTLTLLLLTVMCGLGVASATWGLGLGREALKGIAQPDFQSNPGEDPRTNQYQQPTANRIQILKEEDILKDVKTQIEGSGSNESDRDTQQNLDEAESNPSTSLADEVSSASATSNTPETDSGIVTAGFPKTVTSQGVTLSVVSLQRQAGSLLLNVSLENKGDRSVQFLYSFLDVEDNLGRPLSAIAQGLPGEISPNGGSVSGQIAIPAVLLEDAQSIDLALTDYPEQQVELELSGIPVTP